MFAMQQTLHVNPVKEDRKSTNVPFIIVFSLIFIIWLGIAVTVLGDDSLKFPEELNVKRKPSFEMERINLRFTWKFPVCTILSVLIAISYTYLLSISVGKVIIHIAIYFLCILMLLEMVITVGMIPLIAEEFKNIVVYLFSIFFLSCAPYLVMCFRCAYNVGAEAIFGIIKDSSRAVISHPAIPLFSCGMSVIIVLILTFTVFISKCIVLSHYSDNITHSYFNLFGATLLVNFFINLIHIVISGYVIDWFWIKDQHSSSLTLTRSIGRTLRFHLGTVAFASIPALSHILSIFQACRCRDSDNDIVKRYHIVTRFFSQVCTTLNIVDFALIQTSIYGYDYWTAIMAAQDIVSQNNHKLNVAVSTVSTMVTAIGSILMIIPFALEDIQFSVYSIFIPFYIVLTAAIRALLVNKMIIDYTSEALKDDCDSAQQAGQSQSQTSV